MIEKFIAVAVVIALVAVVSAIPATLFWFLWNNVMPSFWPTAPHIDFVAAWGAWWLLGFLRQQVTVKKEAS